MKSADVIFFDVIHCAEALRAQLARHGAHLPAARYPVKQGNEPNYGLTPSTIDHRPSMD